MGELVGSPFFLYTDAALRGSGFTGLGGWLHGLYFTLRIPDDMLGYPIVQLEFLAVICDVLTFGNILARALTDMMTNSMMSHLILMNDAAHIDRTQFLHLEFLRPTHLSTVSCSYRVLVTYLASRTLLSTLPVAGAFQISTCLQSRWVSKTVETPPAGEFHAVLDRFREHSGPAPSTVKLRRPIVHETSASLGAANVVSDEDGHKGRPLVLFYPCAFLRIPPSRAEEASIKALTQMKQLDLRSTTYKDVSVSPPKNFS
jgi:hypothetical protein